MAEPPLQTNGASGFAAKESPRENGIGKLPRTGQGAKLARCYLVHPAVKPADITSLTIGPAGQQDPVKQAVALSAKG